ncbi:MAG: hypothetical protein NXI32_17595 [bacterium]|nr:hypothetical protein [bacterium]
MSQRERYLTIAVVVVLGLFLAQYVFQRINKTLTDKQDAVDTAMNENGNLDRVVTSGMMASRKLEQLNQYSLPSDQETAISQYRDWLYKLGLEADMSGIYVGPPDSPARTTTAYRAYNFQLRGFCRTDRVLDLLGRFYDKAYLHSVKNFKMTMTNEPQVIQVALDAQVLALNSASPDQEPPEQSSGRLAMSIEEYKDTILNRNPWAPPNTPPKIKSRSADIVVGERGWSFPLEHEDKENHQVTYKLISTDVPEGLDLRNGAIHWTPKEIGTYEIEVEAADNGWPSAVTTEKLVLNVKEPPKPPEPVQEPPKFDVASQAFVTGLTSGRDGRKLWIRSRTDGKFLTLGEGSEFELGEIKAKVLSINIGEDYALLESDGMRWTVDMETSLAEAFKRGMED